MEQPPARPQTVQVLTRVGRILEAFTLDRPVATLTECATAASLSKSSTHRLLASMETIGLVEREDTNWRIGPRVIALTAVRLGHVDIRREASVRLQELGRELQAATAFAVPSGTDVIYLDRHESPVPFAPSARLGASAPMWAGASGRAILARLSREEQQLRMATDEWRQMPEDFKRQTLESLEEAMRLGYATDNDMYFPGVAGVAMAVNGTNGEPSAALSVILTPERLTAEAIDTIAARLAQVVEELEIVVGARIAPDAP